MAADNVEQALDELFVGHRRSLVRFVARLVGCGATAEDLTHEAYLRVAGALRERPVQHLRPFLYQTARNLALDHLRGLRRRLRYEKNGVDEAELVAVPAVDPTPDSRAADSQAVAALQIVLAGLPLRQQQVLVLHKLHGLSQPEVATRLQCSLSTVEKDLRAALRVCLATAPNP